MASKTQVFKAHRKYYMNILSNIMNGRLLRNGEQHPDQRQIEIALSRPNTNKKPGK